MKHYNIPFKFGGRELSLIRMTPDLFEPYKYETVLYVGAKSSRFHFGQEFKNAKYEITILEPFKPNVDYLKTVSWLSEVVEGDIRDLNLFIDKKQKFDIVFWWHGPEHIGEEDLRLAIPELEKICNRMIVLGCPWGDCPQGIVGGNPYEVHVGSYGHEIFEEFGYDVECLGVQNVPGSHITSVKRM